MKFNHQEKYFTNGIILLFLGLYCVTFLPATLKYNIHNYVYYQIEFFLLCAASIFFLFSPKYYKWQIFTILVGVLYYILFVKCH